jgi:alkylmercury lyase
VNKERLLQAWLAWEAERPELERHLIERAFVALCKGIPADVPELAREFGIPAASLRDYAAQLAEHGRVTLEGDAITGAAGLSVAPAGHRLLLAGQSLYTWCALDAVGIPAALGMDATIASSYADGGDVRIEITAGVPDTANAARVRVVPPDQERHLCGDT